MGRKPRYLFHATGHVRLVGKAKKKCDVDQGLTSGLNHFQRPAASRARSKTFGSNTEHL